MTKTGGKEMCCWYLAVSQQCSCEETVFLPAVTVGNDIWVITSLPPVCNRSVAHDMPRSFKA